MEGHGRGDKVVFDHAIHRGSGVVGTVFVLRGVDVCQFGKDFEVVEIFEVGREGGDEVYGEV